MNRTYPRRAHLYPPIGAGVRSARYRRGGADANASDPRKLTFARLGTNVPRLLI